jgi:hypothetical protein
MGSEPLAEEWEQTFGADLLPHLVPAGQPTVARQPLDVTLLPVGAHKALTDSIGHHGLEDLLILPRVTQVYGRLRRRCLYTPLRVLGVGDRAVALWVQAPPAPGIRAMVPFSEMAAIACQANGARRQLLIAGCASRVPVRYDPASDGVMDTLARRLRRRAAGDPAPVPPGYPVVRNRRRPTFDPDVLRLDPDDEIAAVGQHERAGHRMCLLAATPRELVIMRSFRSAGAPGRMTESIYVPRRAVEQASIETGSLILRGAGLDLRVILRSRRTAAAASAWLGQVLSGHDHSGASS